VLKFLQGKSKEENKKIEGTSFGFPKMALLDYPVIYLEKIFVRFSSLSASSLFLFIQTYLFKLLK